MSATARGRPPRSRLSSGLPIIRSSRRTCALRCAGTSVSPASTKAGRSRSEPRRRRKARHDGSSRPPIGWSTCFETAGTNASQSAWRVLRSRSVSIRGTPTQRSRLERAVLSWPAPPSPPTTAQRTGVNRRPPEASRNIFRWSRQRCESSRSKSNTARSEGTKDTPPVWRRRSSQNTRIICRRS